MSETKSSKYAAYICYSHRDEKAAAWLHHHLERYRIPRGVAPSYGVRDLFGRRIGRVFRDREELPAGQPLTPRLYEALAEAEALIVLCSPNAVRSRYVNAEIAEFRRLGKASRLFPVILDGDPPACYPAEINESGENLNADMRTGKDGSDGALVKVLAGLMGVGPDDLLRRERRAQRRRLTLASGGAAVFGLIAALAIILGVQASRNATRAHDTLIRIFAERGQRALVSSKPLLAMRYALAAQRLSQQDSEDYVDLLTSAYDRVGEGTLSIESLAAVDALAFSPDGRRIVSGGDDGAIRLWDATTGHEIGVPLTGHKKVVNSVAFSSDGRRIVSGGFDGTIRVWDVTTGREIGAPLIGHDGVVYSVAFSPDGRRIVSGGFDGTGTIRLWDVATGREIGAPFTGDFDVVKSVAFSSDGSRIVSGDHQDGTIRLWDATTGRQIGAPLTALKGHYDLFISVAFSAAGRPIVLGGADGTLRLWDATTGNEISAQLAGPYDTVTSLALSPDGRRIVSGGNGGTIIWDVTTGRQIGVPLKGSDSSVKFVSPLPGKFLGQGVKLVAFSLGGRRIVSGDQDGTIRFWDATTALQIGAPLPGHDGVISGAFSRDGRRIVSGGSDNTFRLWDTATGRQIGAPLTGHYSSVMSVAFSPDGRQIVSGGDDGTIKFWDTATGHQIGTPLKGTEGHEIPLRSVAFSLDGRRIVSGGQDGTIRLWDTATGRQISAALTGHVWSVLSVAFSPDGRRIVSGGEDRTIRLWDAATGRQIGASLVVHDSQVLSAAFSPDGRRIVSGQEDKTIRLWNVTLLSQNDLVTITNACVKVLGSSGRRFSAAEIQADPILFSEWPDANRDVCEAVPGVPPLANAKETRQKSWAEWLRRLFGWV